MSTTSTTSTTASTEKEAKLSRGRQLSQLLSFLDLFRSFGDEKETESSKKIAGETATIFPDQLHQYESAFLTAAFTSIQTILASELKVKPVVNDSERSITLAGESGKPLTNESVCKLVEKIEQTLDDEGAESVKKGHSIFDYHADMNRVLKAATRHLVEHLGSHVKDLKDKLKDCKIVPITPSGDEFMAQFEVSFETNYTSKQIAYPNPDFLTDAHLQVIMDQYQLGRKSRGRIRRDVFFWVFDRTCHEIFHLVQGAADQKDKDSRGWSAEHDASLAAYSLLYAIAQDKEESDLFTPGFLEEILTKTLRDDYLAKQKWSKEEEAEYVKWRDAFGLVAPSAKVMDDRNWLVSSFCGAIGWELFTSDSKELGTLLTILYKERTGDVYTVKIEQPKKLYHEISSLLTPVKTSKFPFKSK